MAQHPTKQHEYARIERERTFLVERLPPTVDPEDYVRLVDRFVTGTHLRIRRVEDPGGRELLTKIGQKLPHPERPEDARLRKMTTIYLAPGEAAALGDPAGPTSRKRRYTLRVEGRAWSIDAWEAPPSAAGLLLAEVECESDAELDAVRPPDWVEREVTDDPAFSAHALAAGTP